MEVLGDVGNTIEQNKPVPPGPPGQSLVPEPGEQGIQALDDLLDRCTNEGGVGVDAGLSGGARFRTAVLRDARKVKSILKAQPERLTVALRDAIVARCIASYRAPRQKKPQKGLFALGDAISRVVGGPMPEPVARIEQGLGVVLLEEIGERKADLRAQAFAAFLRGQIRERDGDFTGAIREYEQADRHFDFQGSRDPAWRAACLNNLGAVHAARGEYGRALELFRTAETQGVKILNPDHPLIATCRENLGTLFARRRDLPQAERYLTAP